MHRVWLCFVLLCFAAHYSDVIMGTIIATMASHIIGISIVYSTFCPDADQRKHQREFPAQRASNVENVSIWWLRHGGKSCILDCGTLDLSCTVYPMKYAQGLVVLCFALEFIIIHGIISMGYCKKDVTPLLTHWSYVFLALTLTPLGCVTDRGSLVVKYIYYNLPNLICHYCKFYENN